ncbi:MAG: nitroreductase [Ktedonobacteraceae bacterium]|nr:nitroreductase [Ktedonobacteraceae bacterium]
MLPLAADPRTVSEKDFPATGTKAQQWCFLLNYALLAPSEYNTQPWLFRVCDDCVEFFVDQSRKLAVVDPEGRELLASCGTAYQNLCLALHYFGYREIDEFLYDPAKGNLLLRASMGEKVPASAEDQMLFTAIKQRRMNRHVFENRQVPQDLLADLQRLADQQGAQLRLIRDEQTRESLTRLIVAGDRMQWANRFFRQELASWITQGEKAVQDGLPGYAGAKGSFAGMANPYVVRTFDLWREEAARDRQLASASPVLAVLHTATDKPADWFAAGRAAEMVLLRICAAGLQTSIVNQPIEVSSLRYWLHSLLPDTGYPQMIFRIGYGPEAPLTPRRSVQDILLEVVDTAKAEAHLDNCKMRSHSH